MSYSKRTTLCSILAGLLLWLPTAVMAAPVNDSFDHFTTGFSLTGGHRAVECDACHTAGQFRGTPRECASCHNLLMNTGAVVKSSAHIQTSNDCQTCHSTLAWDDVRRVNHMAVLGNCKSCHFLGGPAGGPPNDASHNLNTQDCITCHRTSTWASVHFNHGSAGAVCTECHSLAHPGGIAATPPPGDGLHNAAPIQSGSVQCNKCHSTHNWRFGHSGTAGQCSTCHNSATFAGISSVRQKPTNDFHNLTTLECDSCHRTNAWTPASWDHTGAAYYPDHTFTRLSCADCHGTSGNYSIAWSYAPPDCITCHLSDWRKETGDHNSESADHDCRGCHKHSNSLRSGDWD